MKRILITSIFTIFTFLSFSQKRIGFYKNDRITFYGWSQSCIDFTKLDIHFFNKILPDSIFPVQSINPVNYSTNLVFARKRLYTNLAIGYWDIDTTKNDSLKSKLNQFFMNIGLGYNIVHSKKWLIAPYVGFKYNRYKHVTSLLDRKISIDDYLKTRDIDLRINQFVGTAGISCGFNFYKQYNVGFYAAYVYNLHKYPIIKTKENAIINTLPLPIRHFNFGIGMGVGISTLHFR